MMYSGFFHSSMIALIGTVLLALPATVPAGAESAHEKIYPLPQAKPNVTAKPKGPEKPAKTLFGAQAFPAKLPARSYGFYSKGCLAGGQILEQDGPAWQVMRLSRNRNWGHPKLIEYVKTLAVDAKQHDGWPGLLVGDIAQPRGGPMVSGHASHQIGLDADIWLRPAPNRQYSLKERENVSSISMISGPVSINKKTWTDGHAKLIRRAASYPEVARIFVHAAIKKALCDWAGKDRSWLRKVRPWYGHHYHFHVRLNCPAGNSVCRSQKPPPQGDGCGKELSNWLKPPPKPKKPVKPVKKKKKVRKRLMKLADLPRECRAVLYAD